MQRLTRSHYQAKERAALQEQAFIEWVFPNKVKVGKPLDASHFITRVWQPLLEKAGLRRINFHVLRHTYASHLIMRGESLAYVKNQLGHSSIQVRVDLYGHLLPGMHRGAIDALAEATKCNPGATSAGRGVGESAGVVEKLVGRAGIEPAAR